MTFRETLVRANHRAQGPLLRGALALPEPVRRRLAGRPVVRDGQTLASDLQLMLRLQRIARETGAEAMPLADGRAATRRHAAATGGDQPIGEVRELTAAGLPARLYVPRGAGPTGPLMVFFHGGGFVFGDLESHDAGCRFLAERSGVRLLAVDYRLAPEARYPAAHDDADAAYRWAVANAASLGGDLDRLAVGGDSAGGNLAAAVAVTAQREGLPLAFQLLVYPATDMVRETESARMFAEGFYLTRAYMDLANASYLEPGQDLRDPRLSMAYADLDPGLAPAYVVTAGFDPLRDEGEAYARRLAEAGVSVELKRFPDQIHGFFNIIGVGTTSRACMGEVAAKLKAALA
ncbi:MAG: alpha/beta hydrolase [Nocardioides sp.]